MRELTGDTRTDWDATLGGWRHPVQARLGQPEAEAFAPRPWAKDGTRASEDCAPAASIGASLGWPSLLDIMRGRVADLEALREEVHAAGLRGLCSGEGGSSLAPKVFEHAFPRGKGALILAVLDTGDAATIRALEAETPLEETLFIVASKLGTTAETLAQANVQERPEVERENSCAFAGLSVTLSGLPRLTFADRAFCIRPGSTTKAGRAPECSSS